MNKYAYNFINFWLNLLPPNKRLSSFIGLGKPFMTPLTWLHNNIFTRFYEGDSSANYDNSATYTFGNQIRYIDKCIYLCIKDCTGITPVNTSYWLKTNSNFIGIKDQLMFTSQIALMEYFLNTWFARTYNTTPSQPPLTSTYTNDIYIETNDIDSLIFLVATTDILSGNVSLHDYTSDYFVGTNPSDYNQYSYTIKWLSTIPTDLGISNIEFEKQLTVQANKLNLAGLKFNTQSY